jgi:predicted glycoside hydrolase/deacetylase ChbG (UPF0249 family)
MNPLLPRLGLPHDARAVILHVDDIGMCHASVEAFTRLAAGGLIVTGSVMVPCPWFPAVTQWARAHFEGDLGIHLTLTSEWQNYRWPALSTTDGTSELVDDEGYLPHTTEEARRANPNAALAEWRAQIARARAGGIDVTHLDTHMFSALTAELFPSYLQLAAEERLPCLVPRQWTSGYGFDAQMLRIGDETSRRWEEQGHPLIDRIGLMGETPPDERLRHTREILDAAPPGSITEILFHPAIDTPELRACDPHWIERVGDFDTLQRDELRRYLEAAALIPVTWRAIRDARV